MVNHSNPPTTIAITVIGRNSGKTGTRSWEWAVGSIPPSSLELSFHSTAISIVQCEDHLQESLITLFVLSCDCSGAGPTSASESGLQLVRIAVKRFEACASVVMSFVRSKLMAQLLFRMQLSWTRHQAN